MKRYFIELSYNGSPFNGWQRQKNAPSVQQTIEDSLSKMLRVPTEIIGCGRTDTGVHASFYIAHFDTDVPFTVNSDFIYHLNCILPNSIAIHDIYESDKHARFDALEREYQYFIQPTKNPFNRNVTWQLTTPLDLLLMNTASVSLVGQHDFASFAKLHSDNKTNICTIYRAVWEQPAPVELITFTISADRFLRGMVRAIVGTLVDVGRGKVTVQQFNDVLKSQNRANASAQAPAQGLFLTDIKY